MIGFALVIIVTVLAFGLLLLGRLESYLLYNMENSLANQVITARGSVEFALSRTGVTSLQELGAKERDSLQDLARALATFTACRIVVTDQGGKELVDSAASTGKDTNFGGFEEVGEAIRTGYGADTRDDAITHCYTMYVAYPIRSDKKVIGVIRISKGVGSVESLLGTIRRRIGLSGFVAAVMALIVSSGAALMLARPLHKVRDAATRFGRGELSARSGLKGSGEMADLSRSFDRMADRIEKTVVELGEIDAMKSQFVANVSHELRTPLTAIKGLSETLVDGAIDDPRVNRKFAMDILSESERLLMMVNNALNLARLEAGVLESKPLPFDLANTVAGVVDRLMLLASRRGVDVRIEHLPPEPTRAYADPSEIDQAVANIIDNAIKYSETGDLVRATLRSESRNGQAGVALTIADEGRGIDPAELDLVFDRFFQAGMPGPSIVGTGLGLAIARHNIESSGGAIEIESEPGAGTAVTVWLPGAA
ncbi:MAG: sensor histidine kinase [Candidatus Geothermincolia bacterium]